MESCRVDEDKLKVKARKTAWVVILFIFTYLLMSLAALALLVVCVIGFYRLFMLFPNLITPVVGLACVAVCGMVVYVLFRFMLTPRLSHSDFTCRITEKDEPEFFRILHELTEQIGAIYPENVYLIPEANASVSLDGGLRNLFFIGRKNLYVGMGAINTLSVAELKAVLAHEFAHFAQKTFRTGAYVYQANQVLYGILAEDESVNNLLWRLENFHFTTSWLASISKAAMAIVRWPLNKIYAIINISNYSLSRDMEFHADEIAAREVGKENLKNALLRLIIADEAYNGVLKIYNKKINDKVRSRNIYPEQRVYMDYLADLHNFKRKGSFPQPTLDELKRYNRSQVVIYQQWASHPSMSHV